MNFKNSLKLTTLIFFILKINTIYCQNFDSLFFNSYDFYWMLEKCPNMGLNKNSNTSIGVYEVKPELLEKSNDYNKIISKKKNFVLTFDVYKDTANKTVIYPKNIYKLFPSCLEEIEIKTNDTNIFYFNCFYNPTKYIYKDRTVEFEYNDSNLISKIICKDTDDRLKYYFRFEYRYNLTNTEIEIFYNDSILEKYLLNDKFKIVEKYRYSSFDNYTIIKYYYIENNLVKEIWFNKDLTEIYYDISYFYDKNNNLIEEIDYEVNAFQIGYWKYIYKYNIKNELEYDISLLVLENKERIQNIIKYIRK